MTPHDAPSTELLRVEVTVPLSPEAAFDRFVGGMAGWWPAGTSLRAGSGGADVLASIEPAEGGPWIERGSDGEHLLGEVATWDPPRLVGLTWRPDGDVSGGVPGGTSGRVEVRTAPVDDDMTTVIVEHHLTGAAATDGSRRRLAGEGGWWTVLRAYVTAARGPA